MISSRVRHNKTHPHGHHDVHARQGKYRQNKRQENFLPRRDSRPSGASRASQMQSIDHHCTPTLTIGSKMLISGRTGTGVESGAIRDRKFGDLGESQGDRQRDLPQRISLLDIFVLLLHCAAKLLHVRISFHSPVRAEQDYAKLRHLTKWAGAAVRMGQQGGQTEALWTHLDPSKPQERLHAPAGAHARSAATCHNHTEQEASDHGRNVG